MYQYSFCTVTGSYRTYSVFASMCCSDQFCHSIKRSICRLHMSQRACTTSWRCNIRRLQMIQFFWDPSFFHGPSDHLMFNRFFGDLAGLLTDCNMHQLRPGSDDGAAMRQSMSFYFHGTSKLYCTRHFKVGVPLVYS